MKGQWNAIFLNFWRTVMLSPGPVGRSYGSISLAPREELIVFAYQIWKTQFLSVVQFPFDNCHSPFSPTTFLEYVCVERTHEKKMDTHLGEKTHTAEKLASIRAKKTHVYRVIILEQMADHTFDPSIMRVVILHSIGREETRNLTLLDL